MRQAEYLLHRYRSILSYTGYITAIIGLVLLVPLLNIVFYRQEHVLLLPFLIPGLSLIIIGFTAGKIFKEPFPEDINYKEGTVIVVLSWIIGIFAGSLPFIFGLDLPFIYSLFESTSGWTTTGLSILDVPNMPKTILFYRSILQYAGGAGFAIIMLTALAGPAGTGLSSAEAREEQLAPHVKRSSKLVLMIYASAFAFGTLLLFSVGMNFFDAINHAMTAVSTGGFSTHFESVGYWNSPLIEGALILLMLIGGTNFMTTHLLFHGKFRFVVRNSETRIFLFILLLAVPVVFFGVTLDLYPSLSKAARAAIFENISAFTTTGFTTVHMTTWNSTGWLIIILGMLIGGGTGCTAGGMKQHRIYVLYRGLLWELKHRILPKNVVTEADVWHGEERFFINDAYLKGTSLFIFLYLLFYVLGSLVFVLNGFSLQESLFEFASALGTVGLSTGITSPEAPHSILSVQILGMLLGRLEFFAILIGTIKLLSDTRYLVSSAAKNKGKNG